MQRFVREVYPRLKQLAQRSGPVYGRMFWFSRKKFAGSYLRLSA
jgi:hypothetical protein